MLKCVEMPELEVRVRTFIPTSKYQGHVSCHSWSEDGWKQQRLAFSQPYGIPYTEYVECKRLELWAIESYKCKMIVCQDIPGRALLSAVALQDSFRFSQVC